MRTLALVAVLLSLGCIHRLSTEMEKWVGVPEAELVAKWGAPNLTATTSDGGKTMTWLKPWTYEGEKRECRQSFTIKNERVASWSASGCPSVYQGR